MIRTIQEYFVEESGTFCVTAASLYLTRLVEKLHSVSGSKFYNMAVPENLTFEKLFTLDDQWAT